MKKIKYYVTEDEWTIILYALTDLRNKRIAEGRCIDTVNDTILAIVDAKTKRMKVAV